MKKIEVSDLKLLEILARIPFFKQFTSNEKNAFFAGTLSFLRCRPQEKVISKGEYDPSFYIILSGTASVRINDNEAEVATLGAGYFIGEGAFVMNRPHGATVVALSELVLIRLDQDSLRRFPFSIREKIKDQIISGMAMRLMEMNDRLLKKG